MALQKPVPPSLDDLWQDVLNFAGWHGIIYSMNNDTELVDIETKLSYLENTLIQLNERVINQEKRIARLEDENKVMSENYQELWDSVAEDIPNRKPPHY
jgi:SlyX protein